MLYRGRTSESASQRQKRKREDRPDVFDHLAQLRRKQHRFEMESLPHKAQEVPASPLLLRDAQDPTDVNLSFHGKTPVKSTCKAYSYDISKRGPSSRKETSNFTSLSDASFTQTQLHYESITNPSACMSYSSGSLTQQPVDELSEFDQFSSDSAVDRHSRDELLLHTERPQADISISDHLAQYSAELDTSFSVPSLDQEDTVDFDDHEVVSFYECTTLLSFPVCSQQVKCFVPYKACSSSLAFTDWEPRTEALLVLFI